MITIPLSSYHLYAFTAFYRNVKESRNGIRQSILLLISLLSKKSINILLADDDLGSREIFVDAIAEIAPHVTVNIAVNGQKLMNILLSESGSLPDIIFLDLNMPLKNGHECLQEIRSNNRLKDIPVIIYSTSSNEEHIEDTYDKGANFYLIKPDSFSELKLIARNVLSLDWVKPVWPVREKFVLIADQFK